MLSLSNVAFSQAALSAYWAALEKGSSPSRVAYAVSELCKSVDLSVKKGNSPFLESERIEPAAAYEALILCAATYRLVFYSGTAVGTNDVGDQLQIWSRWLVSRASMCSDLRREGVRSAFYYFARVERRDLFPAIDGGVKAVDALLARGV